MCGLKRGWRCRLSIAAERDGLIQPTVAPLYRRHLACRIDQLIPTVARPTSPPDSRAIGRLGSSHPVQRGGGGNAAAKLVSTFALSLMRNTRIILRVCCRIVLVALLRVSGDPSPAMGQRVGQSTAPPVKELSSHASEEDKAVFCDNDRQRMKNGLAQIYASFVDDGPIRSIAIRVRVDGRIRSLLANRPSYRPCEDDNSIYDQRWAAWRWCATRKCCGWTRKTTRSPCCERASLIIRLVPGVSAVISLRPERAKY
jgi:hypothetical protein